MNKPLRSGEVITILFLTVAVCAIAIGGDDFAEQYEVDFWSQNDEQLR